MSEDHSQPNKRLQPLRRDAQNRQLCSAHSRRTGEPCNSPAVAGMRVCRMHGGSTNHAKRKARLRLAELVDPAIATLAREMTQADKSGDKQNAANSILDRAGWGRVQKVETADARELLVQRLIEMQEEGMDPDDFVVDDLPVNPENEENDNDDN